MKRAYGCRFFGTDSAQKLIANRLTSLPACLDQLRNRVAHQEPPLRTRPRIRHDDLIALARLISGADRAHFREQHQVAGIGPTVGVTSQPDFFNPSCWALIRVFFLTEVIGELFHDHEIG